MQSNAINCMVERRLRK